MVRARNHHSSALAETDAGTFLYVMGGVNGGTLIAYVDRAKVNDDGSLGAFEALPQRLLYPEGGGTAQRVGRVLMVAGGTIFGGVTDLSQLTRIEADGSLGQFLPLGSTGHPRMHPASLTRDDYVYVMGGFRDPDVWDDVVKARWYPNETLGNWEPAGKLPGPRTHMAVTRVGEYVYLTGGLDQSAFSNPTNLKSTHRGHFDADGNLGEWTAGPDLPEGICTHASAFWGGYLYVMGGINTVPEQEKRVWRSPIGADHALGAWEEVASLPVGRGHVHDLPIFKNHLYSIAGAIDFNLNSTGAIQVGTFEQR